MDNAHPAPLALIVDDDSNFRYLARTSLEQSGFRVEDLSDGTQTLSEFDRLQPDVILLDISMQNTDGFTLCRDIRQRPKGVQVPILMITGLDDAESIRRAYDCGATDFITKPINWLILGQRVSFIYRANQALIDMVKKELVEQARTRDVPDSLLQGGGDSPIDVTFIDRIRMLEKTVRSPVLGTVISTYLREAPDLIRTLRESVAAGDLSTSLLKAIHLRSMSTYLGALRLAALCKEIETIGQANFLENAVEVLQDIQLEFDLVRGSLLAQIDPPGAGG